MASWRWPQLRSRTCGGGQVTMLSAASPDPGVTLAAAAGGIRTVTGELSGCRECCGVWGAPKAPACPNPPRYPVRERREGTAGACVTSRHRQPGRPERRRLRSAGRNAGPAFHARIGILPPPSRRGTPIP
jgi:hypothetical protein